MKKPVFLALSLALALSLTACTGSVADTATPAPSAAPTPEPVETWSPVYADLSKLDSFASRQPVYTRRYEQWTDQLIPADDYGPLLPFAGATLATHYPWSDEEDEWYEDSYLYGLVTLEGEVVVDPVFSSVQYLESRDDTGHLLEGPSLLVLTRVFTGPDGAVEARAALAAPDGSWVSGFDYYYDWEMGMGMDLRETFPVQKTGNRVVLLDTLTGKQLYEVDYSAYLPQVGAEDEAYLSGFSFDRETGWCAMTLGVSYRDSDGYWKSRQIPLLFDPQGNRVPLPDSVGRLGEFSEGLVSAQGRDGSGNPAGWGFLDTTGTWVVPAGYRTVWGFEEGSALVLDGGTFYFIDRAGNKLNDGMIYDYAQRHGDYWYFMGYGSDVGAVYDVNHRQVDTPLTSTWTAAAFLADGWVTTVTDKDILLARGPDVYRFPLEWGRLEEIRGDRLLFCQRDEGAEIGVHRLADLNGSVYAKWDTYAWGYFTEDRITKEAMVYLSYYGDGKERNGYYTLDGAFLFSATGNEQPMGGMVAHLWGNGASTLTTKEGKVLFRWPLLQSID